MAPQRLHYETPSNLVLMKGLNSQTLVETDSHQLEV